MSDKWHSRSASDMVTQGVLVAVLLFAALNALGVDIAPLFVPAVVVLGLIALVIFVAILVGVD